jgi:pyruvate dehydrogenase E1 component beta subunit
VPEEEETIPIGKAEIIREGKDLTMISYGSTMRATLQAADKLQEEDGVDPEVIDLMTISPLDHDTFANSVQKTGRVVIVHEAPRSFGPGAEIVSRLVEKSFWYLEAPIKRVTGFDIIMPLFAYENEYIPGVDRILKGARDVLSV